MSNLSFHNGEITGGSDVNSEAQDTSSSPKTSSPKLSTSFNAYPLECSSNLFKDENDMIFMPTGLTDLPLSVSPTYGSDCLATNFDSRLGSHPVCHGFFFPVSTAGGTVQGLPQNNPSDSVPVQQLENYSCFNDSGLLPVLKSEMETRLLVLLLQQLIALQITGRLSGTSTLDTGFTYDGAQGHVPQTYQSSFPPAAVLNKDQNMHTYLVPVEAKLEDHEGLAFHVTPRDPSASPNIHAEDAELKMECTADRLVLYPCSTLGRSATDTFPAATAAAQNTAFSELPAATMTLSDIKQCIRRGSLEVSSKQHTNFVKDIKGQAKPGFALLSIRRGEVVQDQNAASKIVVKSHSAEEKIVDSLQEHCVQECQADIFAAVSRKGNKRKQRFCRSNTDPQKRSCKRNGRFFATSVPNIDTASTTLDLRQITVSRFRVSRFADKKQSWLAPTGSGCFVVHDLWTTKLPEYVIKRVDESKTVAVDSNLKFSNLDDAVCIDEILGADCLVCQGTLPWEDKCKHEEYCSLPRHSQILPSGLSVYTFLHSILEWTPSVPRWLQSSIDWCCQSNVWCPELHTFELPS